MPSDSVSDAEALADALERADWSNVSIGNKVMITGAIAALRTPIPVAVSRENDLIGLDVDMKLNDIIPPGVWADRVRAALAKTERAAVVEECARHIEREADIATNSRHCGDNSQTIAATHRVSRAYYEAAMKLRALVPPLTEG